jgi:uncharacterized protein YecE (DUF72 family)
MADIDGLHDREPGDYLFREIHPLIFLGTASDRYRGWMGQIYTPELYHGRIQKRTRQLAGNTFLEEVLPVDSVREYFQHFRVLELDFTFYGFLLDEKGNPTSQLRTLERYSQYLGPEDLVILKAPQAVTAQRLTNQRSSVPNPTYLNRELFTERFLEPAKKVLGENLAAIVLEQEYQPSSQRLPAQSLAEGLEEFFRGVPSDTRYHLELRTKEYLTGEVFSVMERYGVGQVLSHWTWLPPLRQQVRISGGRFLRPGRSVVVRLMTPRGVRYEEAYAKAFPFDRLVDGMLQTSMIEDTVWLMERCIREDVRAFVIVNNRAGGNAPEIARLIAQRFLSGCSLKKGEGE